MFEFIQSTGKPFTVIDSAILLENPKRIMQQYCAETGLPYDDKMLTWSPGVAEDWTTYKYYKDWHWNAMYSTGFNSGITKSTEEDSSETIPAVVEEKIEKVMPYYQAMFKHCMS